MKQSQQSAAAPQPDAPGCGAVRHGLYVNHNVIEAGTKRLGQLIDRLPDQLLEIAIGDTNHQLRLYRSARTGWNPTAEKFVAGHMPRPLARTSCVRPPVVV